MKHLADKASASISTTTTTTGENIAAVDKTAAATLQVQKAFAKTVKKLESKTEAKQRQERERLITIKYRRVRFFERQKLERKIKSATGQELAKLQEDLRYVRFFPKGEKYVSILTPESEMSEKAIKQRNRFRELALAAAAKAMAENDNELPELSSEEEGEEGGEAGQGDEFFMQ